MRSGGRGDPRGLRIGIDAGGTFTDLYVSGPGVCRVLKVPSTPADPAAAVIAGLAAVIDSLGLSAGARRGASVIHGTTVGTNALLTRSIARTAFVTTAGFEDLIEVGRQTRARLYDLNVDGAVPLVPRDLRLGVRERVAPSRPAARAAGGAARVMRERYDRVAPSAGEIGRLVRRLRRLGVESVAVGFLHAYLDPRNERLVGRALRELGIPVTLSHEISGEFREFERFSTAIANAALRPLAGNYLARLRDGIRPARLSVLLSDGTTALGEAAAGEPVRTVLSGPAGGVLAAFALGRRLGDETLLTLDMGGTSTDVAFIDGCLPRVSQGTIGGIPIRSPMIEVLTVGAGGGSLARRDAGGGLRVGPESAGADPGPACYGRGELPTVTDAHLVLGRLPEGALLGGAMPLDRTRSRRAITRLARALGIGVERTAEGMLAVVDATMENALRAISLERGRDPRGAALYAFGGAGGLHACRLAERLGITRVVIPPAPGAFSAEGLAGARAGSEVAVTLLARLEETTRMKSAYGGLASTLLERMRRQGLKRGALRIERLADLRYAGQSHEITVPYGPGMARAFTSLHGALYRHERPGAAIEVVTLRVRASLAPFLARVPRGGALRAKGPAGRLGGEGAALLQRAGTRRERVPIVVEGRRRLCALIDRPRLAAGARVTGPAIVAEYSATTFVPPGWTGSAHASGALVLRPLREPGR